jgi:hypothetical protein
MLVVVCSLIKLIVIYSLIPIDASNISIPLVGYGTASLGTIII